MKVCLRLLFWSFCCLQPVPDRPEKLLIQLKLEENELVETHVVVRIFAFATGSGRTRAKASTLGEVWKTVTTAP